MRWLSVDRLNALYDRHAHLSGADFAHSILEDLNIRYEVSGPGIEYLNNLNERYDAWIADYPGKVLVIEADDLDFENRPEDFAQITDKIDAQLYGLF